MKKASTREAGSNQSRYQGRRSEGLRVLVTIHQANTGEHEAAHESELSRCQPQGGGGGTTSPDPVVLLETREGGFGRVESHAQHQVMKLPFSTRFR